MICYVPSSVVQGGFTSHKIQICDVFETGCAVFYPLPRSLKIERCLHDGARGGGGGGGGGIQRFSLEGCIIVLTLRI